MQTYTHFLIALALSRWLRQKWTRDSTEVGDDDDFDVEARRPKIGQRWSRLPSYRNAAFLFGSALPDLPLILITVVCLITDAARGTRGDSDVSVTKKLFHKWYFGSPWVISAHNLFHSQVTLLTMMSISFCFQWSFRFWMILSSWIHATSDIPVHHDDGPLIFFPLNWNIRFHSPVSYWDPAYYGVPFSICEHILDLIIILWEAYQCFRYRRAKKEKKNDEEMASITQHGTSPQENIETDGSTTIM